ncbi:MAG TPA: hypothetical protein VFV99_23855 [Kofleriaceae bacterium]|nr:hypothetical protein [Kofleriaceae bacterium]
MEHPIDLAECVSTGDRRVEASPARVDDDAAVFDDHLARITDALGRERYLPPRGGAGVALDLIDAEANEATELTALVTSGIFVELQFHTRTHSEVCERQHCG